MNSLFVRGESCLLWITERIFGNKMFFFTHFFPKAIRAIISFNRSGINISSDIPTGKRVMRRSEIIDDTGENYQCRDHQKCFGFHDLIIPPHQPSGNIYDA